MTLYRRIVVLILVAKFTGEQHTTINQSRARCFNPKVFANCLQVQLTKTLGSKHPVLDWFNCCVLLISEFRHIHYVCMMCTTNCSVCGQAYQCGEHSPLYSPTFPSDFAQLAWMKPLYITVLLHSITFTSLLTCPIIYICIYVCINYVLIGLYVIPFFYSLKLQLDSHVHPSIQEMSRSMTLVTKDTLQS